MEVTETIDSIRSLIKAARTQGKIIGLVPTMGALHTGHISLIEASVKQCDFTVVSIFVNPTQFGPAEDFDKYPRPLNADCLICKKAGANLIFTPTSQEIYESQNITWVNVEKLTDPLCGQSRPNHFRGVTTICAKLFNIIQPDYAFFGQKDAQQAIVIKKMVTDLNMPLQIVICPTIRQPDGLAISSRNQYLTPQQKQDATLIHQSLQKCQQMTEEGTIATKTIIAQMRKILEQAPSLEVEYISIVDTNTLQNLENIADKALVAIAAKIASTRLIDNILIDLSCR